MRVEIERRAIERAAWIRITDGFNEWCVHWHEVFPAFVVDVQGQRRALFARIPRSDSARAVIVALRGNVREVELKGGPVVVERFHVERVDGESLEDDDARWMELWR